MPLQIRRGTNAEREALIPSNGLVVGELLYLTDSQQVYIGTGNSGEHQGLAVTGFTNENAVDAAGAALVAGAHTNISFTYGATQDSAGRIDATVDLSDYTGTITADAFKGSVFGDDTTLLVNAVDGTFNLDGTVKGDIVPNVFGPDLGSSGVPFNNVYLENNLVIGDATVTSVSTAINLPAGSTVNGSLITTGVDLGVAVNLAVGSTVNGSLITTGVDLGVAVNLAVGSTVNGILISTGFNENAITSDVTGSVFGDDSTLLVDGVSSIIVGDVNNASVTTNSLILPGPLSGIQIVTEGTVEDNYSLFAVSSFQSTADPTAATYQRGRGTEAAPAIIQAGDSIFHNIFLGVTNANAGQAAVIEVNVDPNGTVADNIVPGQINLKTFNNAGLEVIGLGLNRNGEITVADNTLSAGASPGNVDDSAAVSYLKITVGATTYAMPLYAIRP
jgi:hypothetical protein